MLATATTPRPSPPPVHNFNACKRAANQNEADWLMFYDDYFSGFGVVAINTIPGGPNIYQSRGIDREILLANGERITVDEKVRAKDYGDCLLEIWSVYRRKGDKGNKVGWALDTSKTCDYVAYAVLEPDFHVRRVLPRLQLVRAVAANFDDWKRGMGGATYPKRARNKRYESHSVAVPWPELDRAMADVYPHEVPF